MTEEQTPPQDEPEAEEPGTEEHVEDAEKAEHEAR